MKTPFKFLNLLASLVQVLVIQSSVAGYTHSRKLELFSLCIAKNIAPSGSVFLRNSRNTSFYEELDYRWSTRPVHAHPLAYFVPTSTAGVQTGVHCAREFNIPVVVKSGGHSAELFSSGSNDTIVISFRNMNKIKVNTGDNTATIEPGAVNGQIKKELWKNGKFGVSTGVCPDVAIGGLALGGGEGVVSPLFGLTIDNVIEMEMVDANGDVHIVNENSNEDLFWALRGAGSGFIGIVTKFKVKIFKASNIKFSVVELRYDFQHAGAVLEAYQAWMKFTIDEDLTVDSRMVMGFHLGMDTRILVRMTLVQDVSSPDIDFLDLVQRSFPTTQSVKFTSPPFYKDEADITNESVKVQDLSSNLKVRAESANANANANANAKVPLFVKMSSIYVDKVFDSSELAEVVAAIQSAPNYCHILWEGTGGAVTHQVPPTATAFVHRHDLYLLSIRINGLDMTEEEQTKALAWYNDIVPKLKVMDNGESYQNYVDLDLKEDYMERYYGVNAQRLIQIKTKWDPLNYFKNPQSIPVSIA